MATTTDYAAAAALQGHVGRDSYAARAGHSTTLLWIYAVAIVVRVLLWIWFWDRPIRIADEQDYHTIAKNLATNGPFGFAPGKPTSIRPPLYPAALSLIYRSFGVGNLVAARAFQAILSLALIALVHGLSLRLYGHRVSLIAAGFVAFYPSLVIFNNLILTEILFTTLLCAGCLAVIEARGSGSLPLAGLAGLTLAMAALTRSVMWLSLMPVAAWLALGWSGRLGARLAAAGVFAGTFALTLAPWSVRNTILEKSFQTVDTMSGRNFMMGNYDHTPMYRAWDAINLEGDRYWFSVLRKAYPDADVSTNGLRDRLAMHYAIDYIRNHPAQTLQRDVVKFFDFWGLERELVSGAGSGYFGPVPRWGVIGLALAIFGSYAAALFLGVYGILSRPLADRWAHALLLLMIALICAAHTLTFGHSRYHLPLMPLLLIYAAGFVDGLLGLVRRRTPAFWAATVVCVVFASGWVWGAMGPDLARFQQLIGN